MKYLLGAVLVVMCSVATTGCLSNTHRIPKQDLLALTSIAPEARGERVRIIQNFQSNDDPPSAERVDGNTTVFVGVHVGGSTGPRHRAPRGGGSGTSSATKAASRADRGWYWVVLAAAVGIGLAATEGARYDGWVRLHPMHPVHLLGANGEYAMVPLAALDQQNLAWVDRAVVRDTEGPWQPLGRAPLNRKGLTYSILLGTAELGALDGTQANGFQSHIMFGYFPNGIIGISLDLGLGWRGVGEDTVFEGKNALDLSVLPVAAGPVHFGGYGQIGYAARFQGNDDLRTTFTGAGLLGQLELTTRLAITARVGLAKAYGERTSEALVGISVY